MTVINTNTGSLYAQQAMNTNSRGLATVMQQLSTGKRINNAVDDVAGLAISTRLTSQIKGLNQAVRNANDAISLIQTAEGATEQVTNMLQRMRELSIQASNDTNNDKDRGFLDLEFQQLKDEIDRIGMNTQWNGKNILDGTAGKLNDGKFTFQIGANANQTIELQLPNLQSGPESSIALTRNASNSGGVTTFSILDAPPYSVGLASASASSVVAGTTSVANKATLDFTDLDTDGEKRLNEIVTATVGGVEYKYTISQADIDAISAGTPTALSTTVADAIATEFAARSVPSGYTADTTTAGEITFEGPVATPKVDLLTAANTKVKSEVSKVGAAQNAPFGTDVYIDLSALDGHPAAYLRSSLAYDLASGAGGAEDASDNIGPQSRLGLVVQATIAGKAVQYKITQADIDESKMYDHLETGGRQLSAIVAEHLAAKLNDQYVGLPFVADGSTGVLKVSATGLESFDYYETLTSPGGAAVYTVTGDLNSIDPSANIKDGQHAAIGLARIDAALQVINEARSKMGAVVSRLQFAADNLFNVSAKATESRSRIEDTDYSQATTELAKRNIIQQAAQAMLAQANQAPQLVLQLLK